MPCTGVTSLARNQRRFPVAVCGFVVRHVVVVGCDGSKRGAVRSTVVIRSTIRTRRRTRIAVVIRSTVGIHHSKRGAARSTVVGGRTRARTRRRSRTVGRFDGSKRGAANRPYPIFVAISVRLTGNYLEE